MGHRKVFKKKGKKTRQMNFTDIFFPFSENKNLIFSVRLIYMISRVFLHRVESNNATYFRRFTECTFC